MISGCAQRPADLRISSKSDVVLVTIDTLRADRVGAYGRVPSPTPNLDRLARSGVTFLDATAHAPLTAPSHGSILTGQYPPRHGLRDNGGFTLSTRSRTLAERLRAQGYHTAAFVASYVLNRGTRLDRGFQIYNDHFDTAAPHTSLPSVQRRGPEMARDVVAWLSTATHPYFLWVHLYDPHAPYDPPPAFAARLPGKPYEAEIATSDWAVGEILRAVDRASRDPLVIVTADHGESLGEHGEGEHGIFLYDATLRVPLIMAGPAMQAGRRVSSQVRHVDIVPTVLEWVQAPRPTDVNGTSLKPLIDGGPAGAVEPSYAESLFGRLHFGWSDLRSIRDGQWKYVEAPTAELYNLRDDPAERASVIAHRRSTASTFSKVLAQLTGPPSLEDTAASPVDAATAARLKSLGYVSGRIELGARAGADPKAEIARYEDYVAQFSRGVDAFQRGQTREAERIFTRLARLFPASFEVHQYLGRTRAARGAHDEALRSFETARSLSPRTALVEYDAAKSLAAQGDYEAALACVHRGLKLEPDTFYGYVTKGQVLRVAGRRADATAAFEKALALSPGLAVAEYELGWLAEDAGDRTAARTHYARAVASNPTMTEARAALARMERRKSGEGAR